MTNLLPCPFCGGTNIVISQGEFGALMGWCEDCDAGGPEIELDDRSRDERCAKAQEAWNRRAKSPFPQGEAEQRATLGNGLYNALIRAGYGTKPRFDSFPLGPIDAERLKRDLQNGKKILWVSETRRNQLLNLLQNPPLDTPRFSW